MNFRIFFIPAVAFAAAVLLSECVPPEPPPEVKKPDKLRPSLIYNMDTVKAFVQAGKGVDTTAAQELDKAKTFIPASPAKAIYHVKNSITTRPSQEAYIRLATLLAETNEFSEARQAWKMVAEVFPGFDKKLFLEMIYASLLDPQHGTLYPFYDLALKEGITREDIRSFLLGDKRLEAFRRSAKFPLLLEYFARPGDKEVKHDFYRFTNEFPRPTVWDEMDGEYEERSLLPMHVDLKALTSIKPEESSRIWGYREYVSEYNEKHDYVGFQPVLRLRGGYDDAQDAFQILLYAIDTSAYGAKPEMRTTFYKVITMGWQESKVISSKVVARHVGEDVSMLKLSMPAEDIYQWEVQHYKRTFKKPFNHKDNDNEVIEMKPVSKEIITINGKGKITSKKM